MAMAEQHKEESMLEKISDKLHLRGGGSSSSSSDSDDERSSATAAVKAKIYRLFSREKPVHSVLGGGKRKPASHPLRRVFFACLVHRSNRAGLCFTCRASMD